MKLLLKRIAKKPEYTIGKLYIDGEFFCNTLEDTDRGLHNKMPLYQINKIKVPSKTAIPTGTYKITLEVRSPKYRDFGKYPYVRFCDAKMPRLLSVPGFEGILIHAGNTHKDTDGCILVGKNSEVGKVLNSQAIWRQLYERMLKDKSNLTIEII